MLLVIHFLAGRGRINCSDFLCSLSVDNVVGIWGVAQSTNSTTLITACLPLLPTDIPRILQMRLTVDQLKMLFQLPWIKGLGAECQLRLVASWIDADQSSTNRVEPIDQLDILLPEVDMPSMAEACFLYFMSENHVVITNQQCRYFLFIFDTELALRQ